MTHTTQQSKFISSANAMEEEAESETCYIEAQTAVNDGYSAVETAWRALGQVHDIHMNMFISIMRIRFAWIIFGLILAWLVSDLVLVYAAALRTVNVWELYAICGGGAGAALGWIISSFWSSNEMHKELKGTDATRAADIIRERVWCYNRRLKICLPVGAIIGAAAAYIYAANLHARHYDIQIESGVLIALITTTTASVIGLLAIVMNWLFPKEKENQNK